MRTALRFSFLLGLSDGGLESASCIRACEVQAIVGGGMNVVERSNAVARFFACRLYKIGRDFLAFERRLRPARAISMARDSRDADRNIRQGTCAVELDSRSNTADRESRCFLSHFQI